MAEYFPLLDRAVSGLTESTAETRRSIYERARTALVGQLRRMDPPVPEEAIARESAALDEAIARVEAGIAERAPTPPPSAPAAPILAAPILAAPILAAPLPTAPARVPPPTLPTGAPPPIVTPPSRERPVLGTRPAPAIDRPAPPPGVAPRSTVRVTPPPRGTRPVMALRPVVPPPAPDPEAATAAEADPRPAAELPTTTPEGAGFADALDAAARDGGDLRSAVPRGRDDASRPLAPRPRAARRLGWPAAALGLVALLLAVGIGIAAYKLRDRPEQVVATRGTAAAVEGATPGKVVDRARPAATDGDAAPDGSSGAAVPAPVPQGLDTDSPAPSIAVAQRAALLVDAPDDPQRVKTYVGTVVWHLDSVSPGGGQPLATAVKADIDIPDAKLKVTMLMQRNPEPQLPASHTIEFHVLPQPGNTLGPIKQINVPEMRKDDDAQTGDPLTGVPVAITDNYFLVGLSRGAAESQNMRLIADRNWFDMSVLFVSGKLGKLTFEKGATGQHVFEDALKAWK